MPASPDSTSTASGTGSGTGAHHAAGTDAPQSLSVASFATCLAILLAIFVFLHPLWEPMPMRQMDENILWSYYPIPLLVLAALAIERKLGWAAFWLETLKLTLVKFVITFLFANVMWSYFTEAPGLEPAAPPPARVSTSERPFNAQQPPTPAPVDPALCGSITGRVVDAADLPVENAVVYVSAGLGGYAWPAPTRAVRIAWTEAAITPDLTLAQTFQPVFLHASDNVMHTAQATDEAGDMLFNYPVLPGSDRELMFEHPLGEVVLSCRAHETGGARLLVLAHPFAARTDANGSFSFDGVPAGALEVAARSPAGDRAVQAVTVEAGGTAQLGFSLP